jgi:D-alanyl-D-alanine dipeptidase
VTVQGKTALRQCRRFLIVFALPLLLTTTAVAQSQDGYRIRLRQPVAVLRAEALRATPPVEQGNFRPANLIDLTSIDPSIHLDIRYATTNNFMGAPLYTLPRAYLQRPAAQALARVASRLRPLGYGLVIYDAYRPWYVTKMMWDGTPNDKKSFVARPSVGSRHNRGCAVDATLYTLTTGAEVPMPSGYDEMSPRAGPAYTGGTPQQRAARDLLRHAMEAEGFRVFKSEWWHFDYKDWPLYRIANTTFEDLAQR